MIKGKTCRKRHIALILSLSISLMGMAGCEKQIGEESEAETPLNIVLTTAAEGDPGIAISPLGVNNNVLPSIEGVTIAENAEELAPVNLTIGVINTVVRDLQQRLMDLGFMELDEPTTYYGDATAKAVQYFQRQSNMNMDGITGIDTWDAIMAPDAPRYAVKLGFQGDDVRNIQYRLYNLGYLSQENEISGNFDEVTENAVKKLQEVNGISIDGTVGTGTNSLLYSEDVKANIIAFGESNDIVKKYQQRLIDLGYVIGEADGNFGQETQLALKAFQSRNDQIIDGYLGADTRKALDSPLAMPYAMRLGEQSNDVKNLQELLVYYGYLPSDKASGYFGELTKEAVFEFQNANGLSADGTAGAKTLAMLNSGNAKKKALPTPTSKPSSSGKTGNTGNTGSSGGNTGKTGGSSGTGGSSSGKTSSGSSGSGGRTVSGSAGNLISIASSKVGSPYVYGAKGPNAFDCSGFVYWALNQAGVGVSYMTSSGWANPGRFKRVSYGELQAGDVVVVSGHVGICAGGGTVIDASSGNGRVVHRSMSGWWANHFIAGWRIFS